MTPARLMGGSNRWRMTVLDRYSVGGPECGVVATAGSFMQAQALARVHAAECAAGAQVEFYDRLARAGRPNRWTPVGGVKGYKDTAARE